MEKTERHIFTTQYYDKARTILDLVGLKREQIVILSIHGSRMYGTETDKSDEDYFGVYIPTKEQLLLNDFPHDINPSKSKVDADIHIWSIHHFMNFLYKGETLSMDLLHAPKDYWLIYDLYLWPFLINNRTKFYTKQMQRFVGFANDQAIKYGIKGKRMKALIKVIKLISRYQKNVKLKDIWSDLPTGLHIHFHNDATPFRMYEVIGKKFHETVKVSYILSHLRKYLTEYGKRAKMAEQNEGIDWKALSHAIKAAEQVFWILKYGGYSFPLKNSNFIKMVKLGKIDFKMARAVLDDYMTEVNKMIETSTLPEKVNKEMWNKWLLQTIESYLI